MCIEKLFVALNKNCVQRSLQNTKKKTLLSIHFIHVYVQKVENGVENDKTHVENEVENDNIKHMLIM